MHKKGNILVIILIIVALGVVGEFAYYTYFKKKDVDSSLAEKHATSTPDGKSPTTQPASVDNTVAADGDKVIDCGVATSFQKIDCFIQAAKSCSPSRLINEGEINLFGMTLTAKTLYELRGMSNGKCIFYTELLSSGLVFGQEMIDKLLADGTTAEDIKKQELESSKMQKEMIGRDGVCEFANLETLVGLLQKWSGGNSSSNDLKNQDCAGEYYGQGEQKANTAITITSDGCSARKGNPVGVTDLDTACFKNQTDIGTIVGPVKYDGKYPQCCVSK